MEVFCSFRGVGPLMKRSHSFSIYYISTEKKLTIQDKWKFFSVPVPGKGTILALTAWNTRFVFAGLGRSYRDKKSCSSKSIDEHSSGFFDLY